MNERERILAMAFGLVIFIIANLILLPRLNQWSQAIDEKSEKLDARELAAQSWISQASLWETRNQWLVKNQPAMTPDITPATLVNAISAAAQKHNVNILQQDLVDMAPSPAYTPTSVRLRMSGSLHAMIAWLYEIQQPDQFLRCDEFRCRSTGDEQAPLLWDITLTRLYRPSTAGSTP